MKALIKEEETTSYCYKELPVPSPEEGDLLVKVKKVALCGSDISLYQWNEGTVIQSDNDTLQADTSFHNCKGCVYGVPLNLVLGSHNVLLRWLYKHIEITYTLSRITLMMY